MSTKVNLATQNLYVVFEKQTKQYIENISDDRCTVVLKKKLNQTRKILID